MARLGFIGSGTITEAILRGLKTSPLSDWPVVLSPRNAAVAHRLAADLPGVMVAASNQAVIDAAEVVVLAVRPQVAAEVISPLRFAPERPVISLIAGLQIDQIAAWTGAASICRAVPLPFVETRQGVTPVFPPAPEAMALFGALGQALAVENLADFDVYAAGSALMGSYFGLVETAESWMVGQGLSRADTATYLRALFGSLGDTLRQNPADLTSLRIGHSTKGGLNERGHQVFEAEGGARALTAALDAILARIAALRAGR